MIEEEKKNFKKTEIGYIPIEWDLKKLNDISEITKGKQLSKLDMLGGEYYVLNGGQEPSGYHNEFNTDENTISISEGGNSCGFVKFNKERFWSGGHNYTLNLIDNVNVSFLYQNLKYQEKKIMSLRVGSGLPNIQKKALQNFVVSLPPLKEQLKIAKILSTVDDQIQQTNQLIEKTTELKKGIMQELLTKGIMHKKFKQTKMGEIPVEWKEATLNSIIIGIESGVSVNSENRPALNNEYGILKTSSVTQGKFNAGENKVILDHELSRAKVSVSSNTIIVSRMNTPALVGEIGYVKDDIPNLFLPDRLWKVTFNKEIVDVKWLSDMLSYEKYSHLLKKEATGTSNSMKNISQNTFLKLRVPFPPLEEQKKIAAILSSVDEDIKSHKQQKVQYEELKKGLMQQLLNGKIRV